MPASQAGRRGFESHLPLHVFNNLQEIQIPSKNPPISCSPLISQSTRGCGPPSSASQSCNAAYVPAYVPAKCQHNSTRKLLILLWVNGDAQLDQLAFILFGTGLGADGCGTGERSVFTTVCRAHGVTQVTDAPHPWRQ